MASGSKSSGSMSASHKEALAAGRQEGRAVKHYLEAVAANKPKRGRKRTPDSIKKRLAAIEASLESAAPLKQLQMVQERMDLEKELESMGQTVDISALEADFVKVAKGYSQRKGISYKAWREMGVAASVLSEAGIGRGEI